MCWFCFQNDTFFETLLKLRRKLLFLGLDCSFGDLGLTSRNPSIQGYFFLALIQKLFNIFWSNKKQNLVYYLEMCWFCFQNDTFFETLLKLRCKLLFSGLDCSFGDLGLTSQRSLFSSDTLIFYKHHPFFWTDKDTSPILWSPLQLCPIFFIRMAVIRIIQFFIRTQLWK